MFVVETLFLSPPPTPPPREETRVPHAFLCLLYSLTPSSLAFQPLPSHILRLHFIHLQIFTMGDLYHSAPCHRRGPRFAVCLLYSGASGPWKGEASARM